MHEFGLRGVISKIRAKWGMVSLGDTADPNSALCIQTINDYLSQIPLDL